MVHCVPLPYCSRLVQLLGRTVPHAVDVGHGVATDGALVARILVLRKYRIQRGVQT